jgi:hypothetical protein
LPAAPAKKSFSPRVCAKTGRVSLSLSLRHGLGLGSRGALAAHAEGAAVGPQGGAGDGGVRRGRLGPAVEVEGRVGGLVAAGELDGGARVGAVVGAGNVQVGTLQKA